MKHGSMVMTLKLTRKRYNENLLKIAVFWAVVLCSLVIIALMMEAARTSETLVNFYQTTWRYNPEDGHLCTHRHENHKSY
jgi:hypothetical protein